jgi:damage-control phosphatase, subfamily I
MMKSETACINCVFKQAFNTAKYATDNLEERLEIIERLIRIAGEFDLNDAPTILSKNAYRICEEVTGNKDPYASEKRMTNETAMKELPFIEKCIEEADDSLSAALHAAAAGNVIDCGIDQKYDLEKDIKKFLKIPFTRNHIEQFKKDMKTAEKILILGDNAGEIVFDTLLVKELKKYVKEIVYCVKSGPIINDATMEDAVSVGMVNCADSIIETGSDDIGVNWNNCSKIFKDEFFSSDIVISKGQGNFESCCDVEHNIYFLLKAKCDIIAENTKVALGDLMFVRLTTPA